MWFEPNGYYSGGNVSLNMSPSSFAFTSDALAERSKSTLCSLSLIPTKIVPPSLRSERSLLSIPGKCNFTTSPSFQHPLLTCKPIPISNGPRPSEISIEPDLGPAEVVTAEELIESKKAEEGIFEEETVASQTIEDAEVEVGETDALKERISKKSESEVKTDPSTVPVADLQSDMIDEDEEIEEDDSGLRQIDSEETDVVFGGEKITPSAVEKFIRQYPDSTLRFFFRRSLDGRPLSAEIEAIYYSWEKRGMSRGLLKKFLLKLMEWQEVPDLPILDLLQSLRDRIYDVSR